MADEFTQDHALVKPDPPIRKEDWDRLADRLDTRLVARGPLAQRPSDLSHGAIWFDTTNNILTWYDSTAGEWIETSAASVPSLEEKTSGFSSDGSEWRGESAYVGQTTTGSLTLTGGGSEDGGDVPTGGGSGAVEWISVTDYGAAGDGSTNDTDAIQDAFEASSSGATTVYVPDGTFLVDDRIEYYSDTRILFDPGAALKAADGTVFPESEIEGVSDRARDRRPLLAPATAGAENAGTTENVVVENLTLDWNNCPSDDKAASPLWIDSASNIEFRRAEVLNSLASDDVGIPSHADTRGHALSITHSTDVLVANSTFYSAGYRTVGATAESKDITLRDCRIESQNPRRHAFEAHSLTSDGFEKVGPVTMDNCTVIVDGSDGQEKGITVHTGKEITVKDTTLIINNPTVDFISGIQYFSETEDMTVENCHVEINDAQAFVAGISAGTDGSPPDENVDMIDNDVYIYYTNFEGQGDNRLDVHDACALGVCETSNTQKDITARGNHVVVDPPADWCVGINGRNVDGGVFENNTVEFLSDVTDTLWAYFCKDAPASHFFGNTARGVGSTVGIHYDGGNGRSLCDQNDVVDVETGIDNDGSATLGTNLD